MSTERESLGAWLGRQLRRKQMSQADLANRIGVTRAAVSAWITDRSTPRPEMLEAIERELGLGAGTSLARADDPHDLHVTWYHRPAPVDGGRDMGNPATFAFTPDLAALAREATQNSLDEQYDESRPVRVRYTLHRITGERLRSFLTALRWDELLPHLRAAAAQDQKVARSLAAGLEELDTDDSLLLLRIDDYNASGLTGDDYEDGRFAAVVRRQLDSHKRSQDAGGSYGLGKATLWATSRLGLVLMNSTLAEPWEGRTTGRMIGRADLPWHRIGDETFAGPAWLGEPDHLNPDKDVVRSWWAAKDTPSRLFLDRDSDEPGTSFLIVGAHDVSGDTQTLGEMHEDLVKGLAANFWAAMIAGRGSRPRLVASVRALQDGAVVVPEQTVDPNEWEKARTRALRAYLDGETVPKLTSMDEVAAIEVPLKVPALKSDKTRHTNWTTEHKAIVLVTPTDKDDPKPNQLVGLRGAHMVVERQTVQGIPLGSPPFQAVLLAGRATGALTTDAAEAEEFLRTAEPPEHDKWTTTDDLTTRYRRGAMTRLNEFRRLSWQAVRDVLAKPVSTSDEGPKVLRDLLRLDPPSGTGRRAVQGFPTIRYPEAHLDRDGAWRVSAEIKLPQRDDAWVVRPVLRFVTRSGPRPVVGWSDLLGDADCEVTGDGVVTCRPGATTARFSGVSDVSTHPVAARMARLEINVQHVAAVTR